jgi:DNA polymerase III alpha subunit (gram-positive type)
MLNIAARARRLLLHPLLLVATTKANRPSHRRPHWRLADKSEPIPPLPDFAGTTPLLDLPLLSLDTETTGLDPTTDRIISLAAAPLLQGCLYLHQASNFLVNPGRPIPVMSTAIHGIADPDVATASTFADHAERIQTLLQGYVLLGHNIIFDALILQHEIGRLQADWQSPPLLDTLLLYATVQPQARNFGLDHAARKLRVSLAGRHTALGDALIVLDLFYRLLPLLAERGIITLAQAQTASRETLERLRERHHRELGIATEQAPFGDES